MGLDNITLAAAKSYVKRSLQGAGALQGNPGKDGTSPTVSVTNIAGGHKVTITDKNGTKSFDVMDGNADIAKGTIGMFTLSNDTNIQKDSILTVSKSQIIGHTPIKYPGQIYDIYAAIIWQGKEIYFTSFIILNETGDVNQYYEIKVMGVPKKLTGSSDTISSNNCTSPTYITGNSEENPFVWNNHEPGVYIFDTYDIYLKATDEDVYNYGTPNARTYNGIVIMTDKITKDSVEDTKLGYYIDRGFRLYNVKFSPNSPTAGRIFRIPVSENEPTLNPVFVTQNGMINVNYPILQAPKSNAVASWYNKPDNGQYLATIDWVKKYAGSSYFVDLTDFKDNYETNCGAPMYNHSFKQIVHNIMYLDYARQGSFMVGDIYTSDTTTPSQYMNCTFYVTVKNENYQQIFIEAYVTDDPISKRYYTIMTRPAPFNITDWQAHEWKAEITKDYVDAQIANCVPSINMKIVDMGDKTTLINIDESFPTDGKNSYIVRGAFVDTTALLLDQEPVHVQRLGTQLFVTTMNGKCFVFIKNSTTGTWYYSGSMSFLNENDVLTRTNKDPYNPTANYHPATKKYVDNKVDNMFSFNADGELVVKIDGVSKTFVPKAEE